jgi:hydrogenase maturation protein HypF
MLSKGLNAPITSSAGRLFDAVAALIGLRQRVAFEGQAAMELEFALDGVDTDAHYDFALTPLSSRPEEEGSGARAATPLVLDWEPAIRAVLDDVRRGVPVGEIAARFHNTLVEMIVAVARRVGEPVVALTGGCFQNRYLTERAVRRLEAEGFRPVWHRRVPPNDGGIALGQVVAALQIRGE